MNAFTSTMLRDATISFPMLGDFSVNPPSYFTIGSFNIYLYGVIIACGFIIAALYCAHRAHEFGFTADDIYDVLIWIIPICIIGARLYYVLFRLDSYAANPAKIFAIRDGGLAIYGGIIFGVLTAVIWCKVKKKRFFALTDLMVFGLLIGQAIGRWGNFTNREAFGGLTGIFCRMGLTIPSGATVYVHPTFLYESLWNVIGFIILCIVSKKKTRKFDGQYFLFYILWYGLGRMWIEGLRTDSLYIGATGIRVSQLLAAVSAIAALIVLLVKAKWKERPLFVDVVNQASESTEDVVAENAETADKEEPEKKEDEDSGGLQKHD